jgi:hypothetical protein
MVGKFDEVLLVEDDEAQSTINIRSFLEDRMWTISIGSVMVRRH